MLTREMLRNFQAGKREVMELRAKMRSADQKWTTIGLITSKGGDK